MSLPENKASVALETTSRKMLQKHLNRIQCYSDHNTVHLVLRVGEQHTTDKAGDFWDTV